MFEIKWKIYAVLLGEMFRGFRRDDCDLIKCFFSTRNALLSGGDGMRLGVEWLGRSSEVVHNNSLKSNRSLSSARGKQSPVWEFLAFVLTAKKQKIIV